MSPFAELGAWASIAGTVVGAAALGVSIWVLLRVGSLSKRLILDIRVPSLIEPLRKAASKLKDAQFEKDTLEDESRVQVRRILASIDRLRDQLPDALETDLSRLRHLETQAFEGSNSSLQELYEQMMIVSDTLEEIVEERRVGARYG